MRWEHRFTIAQRAVEQAEVEVGTLTSYLSGEPRDNGLVEMALSEVGEIESALAGYAERIAELRIQLLGG